MGESVKLAVYPIKMANNEIGTYIVLAPSMLFKGAPSVHNNETWTDMFDVMPYCPMAYMIFPR